MERRPTLDSLVREVIEYLEDRTDPDADDFVPRLEEATAQAVPVMTTTLFQMVVDDNSLAFLEPDCDSDADPFTVLSSAINQEVRQLVRRQLTDDKENSDG